MRYTSAMLAALREDLRHYTVDELFSVKGALSRQGNEEGLELIHEEVARRCDELGQNLVARLISGTNIDRAA